ncbi:P-loop containing nucleoside triphosphate hydrolase protein [Phyllosticta capitalensis]|uniref:P-loop containing nucleoside triphosphate hydrolase protein n=1 Tax=Phyllosticta capitalensis TaxID=121624 RepID=UPI003130E574
MSNFEWNTTVFDSLVMDENLKDIIYRLVKAHTSLCPGFDDFIKGKGRGLIGLLQGPPGSGKTLTAEAIAETAEKPLYVVSSGALGSAPGEIHQNLTNILRLAAHWGAVLLLDEADVFLAKRNLVDLNRNAIVSVFLRELEYYQGILLLTTNQAQIIDDAFQSRMHFFHSYPSLDFSARKRIWQDFIARAQGNQTDIHVDVDETGIEKLAKLRLNGRQIKNAMGIAMTLAPSENVRKITADAIISTTMALQQSPPKPLPKPKKLTLGMPQQQKAITQE